MYPARGTSSAPDSREWGTEIPLYPFASAQQKLCWDWNGVSLARDGAPFKRHPDGGVVRLPPPANSSLVSHQVSLQPSNSDMLGSKSSRCCVYRHVRTHTSPVLGCNSILDPGDLPRQNKQHLQPPYTQEVFH